MVLEYDGADFQGWQRQGELPTVQATLEAALCLVTGQTPQELALACAGRTDAGVHATGQLVSFVTMDTRLARRFAPAINFYLPPTVRVHQAREVALDFDVRRGNEAKWYRYQIYVGSHPSALLRRQSWHRRRTLDVEAMQAAAQRLVGEHDFESFRSAHCEAAHARRRLYALVVQQLDYAPLGKLVLVDLYGNAFCRHMCRILVGTLVEVGAGRRKVAEVPHILAAKTRTAAGVTAPPQGLCLREVYRQGELQQRAWHGALGQA